ncbi:MAG TPA: HD domain-containing phosphohydrolase [Gammaproteobacteria bacterium]|nr:HD domain-containing phosphohydrolase [Gammaproteobacteria bacterium]
MDKRYEGGADGAAGSTRAAGGVPATAWARLAAAAADAVFIADAGSGEILDCNAAAERLCGRPRGRIIGRHQGTLHPADEAQRYRAEFGRAARLGHEVSWDSVLVDAAGERIPVEISSAVAEVDGRRLIMGIFRDVRQSDRAAMQRRESERELQEAVAGAPVPVMVHAEDGEVVLLSREWTRLTGYAREDIPTVERWLECAYDGTVLAEAHRRLTELRERAGPDLQGEFSVRTRDGGSRIWKLYAGPLGRLADGRRLLLSMAVDITDHRLAEAQRRAGAERLERSLAATVEAMARAMAKRDPYTAGHQDRVAGLCVAIAGELRLDPEQARGVRMGAGIHDIGKIYVPSEILNRPGRLSEPEMALIRTHCEVGHDIVRHVEFPWPVGDMILQHHERLDGSGYPRGLTGEAICLEARILAVADVVEAMASYRPYRPGLGIDTALSEVERGRERLYDGQVVDVCVTLFRRKGFELPV